MRWKCGNWQENCKNMCDDFYCTECIKKERERLIARLKKDDLPKASDMTTKQAALCQGLTQEDLERINHGRIFF